jgi:hypothetical protein
MDWIFNYYSGEYLWHSSSHCSACKTGTLRKRVTNPQLHITFKIPFSTVLGFITKLCSQQADVIRNRATEMLATLDKAKPNTANIRGLNFLAAKQATVEVA